MRRVLRELDYSALKTVIGTHTAWRMGCRKLVAFPRVMATLGGPL